jgi:GT2 family glycosyltransferase
VRAVTVVAPTLAAARAERLVRSLAAQTLPHAAILIDNASTDPSAVDRLRALHPNLELVRLPRNAGYSRAANLGARRADGEVLVFVNDDCELEPDFLAALEAALDPGRGVTMAAGVLRDARRPGLIETAGIQIDRTLLAFDYLNGEPLSALSDAPPPFGASGAAAAIMRDSFWDVGGFDEALFAYLEDVDLSLRLRLAGATCALARDAIGTHEHSATLGSGSARKDYLMGFGRGYLLRKWSGITPRRAPGIAIRDGVICLGQAVLDRNVAGIRGRIRGFRAARPEYDYPAAALRAGGGDSLSRTLLRRARRRARIRRP